MSNIKFNKFNVTNTETKLKARVWYSAGVHHNTGRECIRIYAKDYGRVLGEIFPAEYVNETDSQSDYFDTGRVTLFPDHPLYAAAKARAELNATR